MYTETPRLANEGCPVTYSWDRWLEHQRLTLTIDGEPSELELRAHTLCIDHSDKYRRPLFEERSIFNAPADLARRIARARAVTVRLEGQNQVIEKEFTQRNIARVREYVRDHLVGDRLRQGS